MVLIDWLAGRLEDLLFYKMKIIEHYGKFCAELWKYHSLVLLLSVTIRSRDTILETEMKNL